MESKTSEEKPQISATKEHCVYCFETLIASLYEKQLPKFPENLPRVNVPLFVTWHKSKFKNLKFYLR